MKIGLSLPAYDLESGRTLAVDEVAAAAEEAERLGFDSVWLMDHFWLDRGGQRTGSHDPMIVAAYLAARTKRIALGFLVLCNPFRPVGQLGREAAALADAAEGRLLLGLGCGWSQQEFDAFGYPFERLVARFEETLETLPPLLRGERVSYDGEFVQLDDATLLTTASAPPLWVAAFGPRMLRLTAQHADGWNGGWHGPDSTGFERVLGELHAALGDRRIEISTGIWAIPVEGAELGAAEERATRLRPEGAPWPLPLETATITGSAEDIAAGLRRYADLGVDHVILNPSPTPFSLFDAGFPERLAGALPLVR